jgi:hypothetical protein
MEEQIKHFILQLFFSRNNPKMYAKVVRDMHKAHSAGDLKKIIAETERRIDKEGLSFVAPATDNPEFVSQVEDTLRSMSQVL